MSQFLKCCHTSSPVSSARRLNQAGGGAHWSWANLLDPVSMTQAQDPIADPYITYHHPYPLRAGWMRPWGEVHGRWGAPAKSPGMSAGGPLWRSWTERYLSAFCSPSTPCPTTSQIPTCQLCSSCDASHRCICAPHAEQHCALQLIRISELCSS